MSRSERFWDKTASQYDQVEIKDQQTYFQLIQRIKAHLKLTDVVLDLGCGTGLMTNEIAQDVQTIHAIDISSNMIAIAEQKANERSILNINYAHATIYDESLTKGSFDAVLAFHVLHLLDDEQIAIQRMHELLKPGGLLISATPCVGEKPLLKSLLFLAGRTGLVPRIRAFKIRHLVDTIEQGKFSIVEADFLKQRTKEYFIVARRI